MFNNNNDQQQQPPPSPPRRDQPPQQQNQRQLGQGGQNNYMYHPQPNYYEGDYYEQFPSPPRVAGGRRSSSQHPQQGQQQAYLGQQNTTNLSGEYSWMNSNRTINRPITSRLTGAGSGGGVGGDIDSSILPPAPPPGLGQGTSGRGTSISLAEDPPTISSTFSRGVGGAIPWSGGGGAFGAPRAASGASLHSGGPYRGPTPPTPGSSLGQPSYHQQVQQGYEYSGGNAFAAPHYPPQSIVGTSPHRRGRQAYGPEPDPSRPALPSSFTPAPPTSHIVRQQSAGSNFVEVQELPSSYISPYDFDFDFGFGGEEDLIPPPFQSVQPSNQNVGYQYPSQHSVGPMGSIGEYNSNRPSHVQYPSSPPQRPLSRNSNRSHRSSRTPSPRGGRGRGRGGGGASGGGGRGSRPSSRSSSRGSYNDRPFSSVNLDSPGRHSATLRPPSPTASELEALNQSPGRPDSASGRNSSRGSQSPGNRPGSAGSNTSRGSQSPRNRPGSAGSNTSRGSQSPRNRPGSARSNSSGGVRTCFILEYYFDVSLELVSSLTFLCSDRHCSLFFRFYPATQHRRIVGTVILVKLKPQTLKIFAAIHSGTPRSRRSCAVTTWPRESASMGTSATTPTVKTTSNSRPCWSSTMVESLTLRPIAPGSASRGLRPDHGGYIYV